MKSVSAIHHLDVIQSCWRVFYATCKWTKDNDSFLVFFIRKIGSQLLSCRIVIT